MNCLQKFLIVTALNVIYSLQRLDGTELQGWGCARRAGGTFYGGSWGTEPAQSLLTVHCKVVLNTSLTPFQGFLYVFGGMLDSAYSNSRYPLWVFDIGELLCGDERLAADDETCCCTSTCDITITLKEEGRSKWECLHDRVKRAIFILHKHPPRQVWLMFK